MARTFTAQLYYIGKVLEKFNFEMGWVAVVEH